MKMSWAIVFAVFVLVVPSIALGAGQRVDVTCNKESCDTKTDVVSESSSVKELLVYAECSIRSLPAKLQCSSPNVFVACPGASYATGHWLVCKCGPSGASASRTLPDKYKVRTQIQC
jgi:hypothetical protein